MSETLKKLLLILSDGKFHSEDDLGRILGLTQNAIGKLTQQLHTWDLNIESITNKGYRIPGGLTLLQKEQIVRNLDPRISIPIEQIEIFESLPSTNDYLLQLAQQKSNKPYICFAERQTQGKGRHGRAWLSPFAKNIYLSILWPFPKDLGELSGLSLAIAISVVDSLKTYGVTQALEIKWPNDLFHKQQKLGGILIEITGEAHDICSAVIGIGLNVNMASISTPEITQPWTDLQSLLNQPIDRNLLASTLLNSLLKTISLFQEQGLNAFLERWQSLDLTYEKFVNVIHPTATFAGIGKGINSQGHFLLELTPGVIKSFSSGEVSLRLQ